MGATRPFRAPRLVPQDAGFQRAPVQIKGTQKGDLMALGGLVGVNGTHLPGLVFKAHRRLYHSTLGSRVIKKRRPAEAVADVSLAHARRDGALCLQALYIYTYTYMYIYK